MRNFIYYPALVIVLALTLFSSCKKDSASVTKIASSDLSGTIAIGTLASTSLGTTTDSLYLVGCFSKNSRKDSVTFSTLPSAVGIYLTTNYSGYTFLKAYKITDSVKVLTGYVVAIKYNNSPIGLKFAADGTFVKVLEQRGARDLHGGPGFHDGGPFNNRDGKHADTIAVTGLPAAIKSYYAANYKTDTLLHAAVTRDSAYLVISKNAGLFATTFTKAGIFLNRVQLEKGAKHTVVLAANLPAVATNYLTTTYPGYVFDKAFAHTTGTVVDSYDVFITANSTRYVVKFTAAGIFVKSQAIH
ncbi:PepSY-like domain-containing protein [Mucilaginibacter glaciei]|uniref:Uncharacterized protein n=1 Tax=Mucilaginibacter glaciei TaxID=2772109 RepID=A0A926S0W9_9SPHI|nr:PepSY-like domain-containing protein [Mucilaginibacter glaciei]MBD1391554.1 hypothetical protein [Mucilaginibacter glaciei]